MDEPKPLVDQAMTAATYFLHLARGQLAVGNYEAGLSALHGRVLEHLATAVSCLHLDDELRKPLIGLRLAWEQQILAFNTVTRSQRVGRLKNNLTTGGADLRRMAPELAREYEEFVNEASMFLDPRPPATVTLRPINDALQILEGDPFRRPQDKLLPVISALLPQGEVIVEFDPEPVAVATSGAGKRNGQNGK